MKAIRTTIGLILLAASGCATLPQFKGERCDVSGHVAPPRGMILVFLADGAPKAQKKGLLSPDEINKYTGGRGYYHVAYSLGGGRMIHAWNKVREDWVWDYGKFEAYRLDMGPMEMNAVEVNLRARIGTEYDLFEALTKAGVDDGRKWICTSLLIDALKGVQNAGKGILDFLGFVKKVGNKNGFVSVNQLVLYFKDQARNRPSKGQPGV